MVAVVATPRAEWWAFGAHLALLGAVAALARVPAPFVLRRLVFEVPFLLFALLLPFTAGGERTTVAGFSLSVDGLWAAWNVCAKAALGGGAVILLGATTTVADLLRGLDRLRVTRAFTSVAGFMVRYADVVTGEMRRMRIARRSRGFAPRWLWEARALAPATGALFVRSFERGERIHVAMLARGFDGSLPRPDVVPATTGEWIAASSVPALAALFALLALR